MKLRLAGNALRLRIGRSELERLQQGQPLRECIQITPAPQGSITYELRVDDAALEPVSASCLCGSIAVTISGAAFARWMKPDEVGIYAELATGQDGAIRVVIEKDFACLDTADADNSDTFEHPVAGAAC